MSSRGNRLKELPFFRFVVLMRHPVLDMFNDNPQKIRFFGVPADCNVEFDFVK